MKSFYSVLFMSFCLSSSIFSQDLSWFNHFDSDLRQTLKSVHFFSSGDHILNITTYSDFQPDPDDNDLVLQNNGSFSGVLAYYNSKGEHQWSFLLGNEGRTEIQDFTVDQQGNIVVIGYFNGTSVIDLDPGDGDFLLQGGNTQHAFLAKYNKEGQLLWGKALYERSGTNHYMALSDNGTIYVLSRFNGLVTTFGGTQLDAGTSTSNAFLGKYSSQGTEEWVYHIKSSARVNPSSLQVVGNNIFVNTSYDTDITFGPGEFNAGSPGLNSVIARFDPQGDLNATINFNTNGNLYFSRFYPVGNEYILEGRYTALVTLPGVGDIESEGGLDGFFARMDLNGNIRWLKTINGVGNDFSRLFEVSPDGTIHGGIFFEKSVSFDGTDYNSTAKYDFILVSLSDNGDVISTQQISGPESEQVSFRKTLEDGSIYLSGSFKGTFNVDILDNGKESEIVCDDDSDVFIAKYTGNTSPVFAPVLHDISVFPNPSDGDIMVENKSHEVIRQLVIYDVHGRALQSFSNISDSQFFTLPPEKGIYFIRADQNVFRVLKN